MSLPIETAKSWAESKRSSNVCHSLSPPHEARSLDELSEMLLATERHASQDVVLKLLVTAHRLKGSAACVGLNRAAKLAHLMEDELQKLFDGSARLTAEQADALLKCEMVAGHGGVSGRYNAWRERAFELAWLLDVLGVADV